MQQTVQVLVVATPEGDTCMVAQTLYIVFGFAPNVVQMGLVARLQSTGKHKILPHQNTILIAQLVKIIFFINRSEEHTSELQSRPHLVCRLLLEKKKNII